MMVIILNKLFVILVMGLMLLVASCSFAVDEWDVEHEFMPENWDALLSFTEKHL